MFQIQFRNFVHLYFQPYGSNKMGTITECVAIVVLVNNNSTIISSCVSHIVAIFFICYYFSAHQ